MAKGDHICVKMYGVIDHHGIDLGDGNVIHFHKEKRVIPVPPAPTLIKKTTKKIFADGDVSRIFVMKHPVSLPPDQVVALAEHFLFLQMSGQGERYGLWEFNCEHLAHLCKIGNRVSYQVELADHAKDRVEPFAPLLMALVESFPSFSDWL